MYKIRPLSPPPPTVCASSQWVTSLCIFSVGYVFSNFLAKTSESVHWYGSELLIQCLYITKSFSQWDSRLAHWHWTWKVAFSGIPGLLLCIFQSVPSWYFKEFLILGYYKYKFIGADRGEIVCTFQYLTSPLDKILCKYKKKFSVKFQTCSLTANLTANLKGRFTFWINKYLCYTININL